MSKGKEICGTLKEIREKAAEKYGLTFEPSDCDHEADSPNYGDELRDIQRQLEEKGITDVELNEEIEKAIESLTPPEDFMQESAPTPPPIEGMIPDPWDDAPRRHREPERKLFLECNVAGLEFHNADEVWDNLEVGMSLALVRERDNVHDWKAVAIALAEDFNGDPNDFDFDQILGYIPRSDNREIAVLLDMGWADLLEAKITKLDKELPYQNRMTIAIYLKRKEADLRLVSFSDEGWKEFRTQVWGKGFCYFRWERSQSWLFEMMPEEGDKVVFLCKGEEKTELCLMSVIAKGWNCRPYAENYSKLFAYDNCVPFALTQIAGPISVGNDDISFLTSYISERTPGPQLPKQTSEFLKRFF